MKQQTLSVVQEKVRDLQQLVRELESRLEDTARDRETLTAAREEEVARLQAQVRIWTCTAKQLETMKLAMPHSPPPPLSP